MRTIDIHAHLVPQSLWRAFDAGEVWHGIRHEPGAGQGFAVMEGKRVELGHPKIRYTPEARLRDMDEQGVDMQVVSIHTPIFSYHLPAEQGRLLARDFNDEVAEMTRQWPDRFAGLATLPAQDIGAAIDVLDHAVNHLGLKGAELDMVVNGRNWDEPECLPLFKAAESMGALLFFHPQPRDNMVLARTDKYGISNSIGVTVEDALLVATLIYGGIFDACPDLKVCVAHGGGPACFGMGRLDRGWQVRSEARIHIQKPPSRYQSCLYYDCVTDSEPALRYLLDHVGSDRVVLGSDWPFVKWEDSPVAWVKGLESLSQEEKDRILWRNLEALLGV